MGRYRCPCAYVYDESEGCAVFHNPPGTPFEDLPEDWTCPRCGYEKEYFRSIDSLGAAEGPIEEGETSMTTYDVTVFRRYPFTIGEKIHIEDGPRKGDWEVVGVDNQSVTLKCPVSHKEFSWKRFCYFMEAQSGREWPMKD